MDSLSGVSPVTSPTLVNELSPPANSKIQSLAPIFGYLDQPRVPTNVHMLANFLVDPHPTPISVSEAPLIFYWWGDNFTSLTFRVAKINMKHWAGKFQCLFDFYHQVERRARWKILEKILITCLENTERPHTFFRFLPSSAWSCLKNWILMKTINNFRDFWTIRS